MKSKIFIFISGAKRSLLALVLTLFLGTVYSQTYTAVYTGSVQTLVLPQAGLYFIECWGANGGDVTAGPGGGGKGGYAKGEYFAATPGTTLFVFVGGKGFDGTGSTSAAGAGGWNGGGGGSAVGRSGGGGGGATDIRLGGLGAGNRIIVAGGGGGAAYYSISPFVAPGGNGGGLIGESGSVITSGGVLTPGIGGAGANGATPGMATVPTGNGTAGGGGGGGSSAGSSFGQPGVGGGPGGAAGPSASGSTGSAGGGGGGFAGGAGGVQTSNAGVAGGGGSSYVGGVSNGTTIMYQQPGYVPNPDNSGNGYVRITYGCDMLVQTTKNPICIGDQITLSTNAGSNVQWSHGPTTPTVVVSPTANTTYTVSGIGTNPAGCTNTIALTVSVNPLPNIASESFPPVLCEGHTGSLTATGGVSYTWTPGNSVGNVVTVNPVSTTVYTVSGESAHGCKNTSTVTLNVNTNQLVVSPDTVVCEGTPALLRASGAVHYNWNIGAPFPKVTVYPTTSTVYSVTATDANGCPLSGSVSVLVNSRPQVTISTSNTVVCRWEPIQLNATGATTYLWNNGSTDASINPSTGFDLPMTFEVTGTNNEGCSTTASITILVEACVSVEELQAAKIRLMPNPASSEVTIESDADALWQIADPAGRILLEGNLQKGAQSVNISSLAAGVYLVRLQTSESERIIRLIKN